MRIKFAVLAIFGALLLSGCGNGDVCDRPLPYATSSEGGELIVPDGLTPPPQSSQKRIPAIAEDRRARSNPCSVGPPDLLADSKAREKSGEDEEVAQTNAERSPPTPAAPLDVGPLYKSESVEDTVEAWIASWSAGDAPSYLSFYATDFASGDDSLNREEWLRRRQELVNDTGPASISIRDMTVEDLPGGRKMVRMIQNFESSDGQKASVVKLLEMTREFDSWRIRRERVVEVLAPDETG